jgi:putative PIN family toxin of toxin-antitoxin system
VPRIVLDTNVYISAFLFGGVPGALIGLARAGGAELVVSSAILDEIAGVLRRRVEFTDAQVAEVMRETRSLARLVTPALRLAVIREDEPDNRILECAVAGRAHYIGSGDRRHLLPLRIYKGIPILSPAVLLHVLQAQTPPPEA